METIEVWFMVNGSVTVRRYTGSFTNAQIWEDGRGTVHFLTNDGSVRCVVLVRDCIYIARNVVNEDSAK
jgi:hypothetical protein